jgi:hypothetical protein
MEKKYTINEGLESLDRIKLMMGYSLEKTLNENKTTILNEDVYSFPWCVRFGTDWPLDPKNSKTKTYTSVKVNGSGGFQSTNATYQTFNTPYIINQETYRFFSDGTYWKKSPDGKKWIPGVYKCNEENTIKSAGQNGSILFDEDTKPITSMVDKRYKPKKSIFSPTPEENYYNSSNKEGYVMTNWGMKKMPKSEFPTTGDMWDAPKPEPPHLGQTYVSNARQGLSGEVVWKYDRWENGEIVPYSFRDVKGGKEYTKYYNLYEKDLTRWQKDTNFIWHLINNPHARNEVLSMASLLIPLIGVAISSGIMVYDASLYYNEGDKKHAGLCLAFAALPGVSKIFGKVVKLSAPQISKVLKFISNNGKGVEALTIEEKAAVKEIIDNSSKLGQLAKAGASVIKLATTIATAPPLKFIQLMRSLKTNVPIIYNLLSVGVQIGGTMYAYDKVWDMYNKGDEQTKQKIITAVKVEQPKIVKIVEEKKEEIAKQFNSEETQKSFDNTMDSLKLKTWD